MPHILPTLDFTPMEPPELKKYSLMIRKLYEQLSRVMNGLVSFGNGTKRDNIDGEWANVTTPSAPNTDFVITHNMLRLPVGYLLISSDRAVAIYTGSVPPSTTTLTLRASVASAVIRVFII